MGIVTLILPKDRSKLESLYASAYAEAVSSMLTEEEREYLIAEIDRREAEGTLKL